eukprot:scaffold142705_cov27-Tisochrysis_lutea.AAC.1
MGRKALCTSSCQGVRAGEGSASGARRTLAPLARTASQAYFPPLRATVVSSRSFDHRGLAREDIACSARHLLP